jgi:uncharacterized tellurite resistance protein B-like protein
MAITLNDIPANLRKSPEITHAISKGIAGAILADGRIHIKEKDFLDWFHQEFKEYPNLVAEVDRLIEERMPFELEYTQECHPDLALKLFKTVLEICSSDLDLDINEIYFITEAAKIYKIDAETKRQLVIDTAFEIKSKLINRIVEDLEDSQVYYLIVSSLEIVYSSKFFIDKKLPYLDNLVHLVSKYDLFNKIPTDENFKILEIAEEVKMKFIKFFLELTMCDGIWSHFELEMIREIADVFKLPRNSVEWMIYNTQISYRLLHE